MQNVRRFWQMWFYIKIQNECATFLDATLFYFLKSLNLKPILSPCCSFQVQFGVKMLSIDSDNDFERKIQKLPKNLLRRLDLNSNSHKTLKFMYLIFSFLDTKMAFFGFLWKNGGFMANWYLRGIVQYKISIYAKYSP